MKMYCIVARESLLKMNGNRGKLAAQAGHAYLHAWWDSFTRFTPSFKGSSSDCPAGQYKMSGKATKVCLVVETVDELREIEARYRPVCGVSLVTDAGITCFNGEPTVTCLGLGPITDEQVGEDLRSLRVLI